MTTPKRTITVVCEKCKVKFESDPNDPAHKIQHSWGGAIPADGESKRGITAPISYYDTCPNGHQTIVTLTPKPQPGDHS